MIKVQEKPFGKVGSEDICSFVVSNDNGIQFRAMNFGATITSILLPNRDGSFDNIVAGFNSVEGYLSEEFRKNMPYFGATIGRYCSMIKDAKFSMNGKQYRLSKNAGDNNLHGGVHGFDTRIWKGVPLVDGIEFTRMSVDGEEGFPANVKVKVQMRLNDDNELSIEYFAESDGETPFAMTNHSYFNLSGFRRDVLNYNVTVNASKKIALMAEGNFDEQTINVEGKPDDLRTSKRIGDVQEQMGDGFEHFYLFGEQSASPRKVAQIEDSDTSRKLEIFTTESGMLFYTGKYTSDKLKRESGEKFGKFRACCFEAHRCPNGPNLKGLSDVYMSASKPFHSKTIYRIGI